MSLYVPAARLLIYDKVHGGMTTISVNERTQKISRTGSERLTIIIDFRYSIAKSFSSGVIYVSMYLSKYVIGYTY